MDHEIKPEQREKDGKRQVTAAEEQHQAGEVAAARKRALSQRAIEAVKKIEVLLNWDQRGKGTGQVKLVLSP